MNATLPTTEVLTDWLRQEVAKGRAAEEYIWQDPVYCLMGNFFAAHGRQGWGEVIYSDMPDYEVIAGAKPWTYGAALERAEALKALPPPEPRDAQHEKVQVQVPAK